jgi:hypothetical protein
VHFRQSALLAQCSICGAEDLEEHSLLDLRESFRLEPLSSGMLELIWNVLVADLVEAGFLNW